MLKKQRGGKRINAGRKPEGDAALKATIIARVTADQKSVVMQIDNDYTVKRFVRTPEGFYLKAENSSGQYPDIYPQEGQEWQLFGVVNFVIKSVSRKVAA